MPTIISVVYFMPSNPVHVKHAAELHARIRQEFPEVRCGIYAPSHLLQRPYSYPFIAFGIGR